MLHHRLCHVHHLRSSGRHCAGHALRGVLRLQHRVEQPLELLDVHVLRAHDLPDVGRDGAASLGLAGREVLDQQRHLQHVQRLQPGRPQVGAQLVGVLQQEVVDELLRRLVGDVRLDDCAEELLVLEVREQVELVRDVLVVLLDLVLGAQAGPLAHEVPLVDGAVVADQLDHLEQRLDVLHHAQLGGRQVLDLAGLVLADGVRDAVVQVHLVGRLGLQQRDLLELLLLAVQRPGLDDAVLVVLDHEQQRPVAGGVRQVEADHAVLVRLDVELRPALSAQERVQVVDAVVVGAGGPLRDAGQVVFVAGALLHSGAVVSLDVELLLVLVGLSHEVPLQQTGRLLQSVAHERVLPLALQHVLDLVAQALLRQVGVGVGGELERLRGLADLDGLDGLAHGGEGGRHVAVREGVHLHRAHVVAEHGERHLAGVDLEVLVGQVQRLREQLEDGALLDEVVGRGLPARALVHLDGDDHAEASVQELVGAWRELGQVDHAVFAGDVGGAVQDGVGQVVLADPDELVVGGVVGVGGQREADVFALDDVEHPGQSGDLVVVLDAVTGVVLLSTWAVNHIYRNVRYISKLSKLDFSF